MSHNKSIAEELSAMLDELDDETLAGMSADDVLELRKKLNPYGRTIEGSDKFLTFSLTNLSEEYNNKLQLTTMVGFLNRMCDEWNVPDGIPVIPVYEYAKNPSLLTSFYKNWTMTPKIEKDIEENRKWMAKRLIVKEFLEEFFQFNPDDHVKSAYKPQPKDKNRTVLETPAAKLAIERCKLKDVEFREQMLEYDRTVHLMNMSKSVKDTPYSVEALNQIVDPEYPVMDRASYLEQDFNIPKTVYEMIPPKDTMHRFKFYQDANYEALREATKNLYCDVPDLEFAINPYQWHDTAEDAEAFTKKHKNEVITVIYTACSGKWTFLAPFQENRDNVKYFNENTVVLEEIMKQTEDDAKLGGEMMKKRIKKKKMKNVEEEGADDEAFLRWKKQNNKLAKKGAVTLNENSFADDDIPDDAVQVNIFRVGKGGLTMTTDKMFIEAEAPILEEEKKA